LEVLLERARTARRLQGSHPARSERLADMCLLVPIDISAPSRAAIDLAAVLAQALDTEAVLLHVSSETSPLAHLVDLYTLATPLHEAGLNAHLRTVAGEPATAICQEAERRHCGWVIMGTRFDEGKASVARAVLCRCAVPVVAVRPGPTTKLDAARDFGTATRVFRRVGVLGDPASAGAAHALAGLLVRASGGSVDRVQDEPQTEVGNVCLPQLEGWDLVVVPYEKDKLPSGVPSEILDSAPCPVALVSAPVGFSAFSV
jgi:nucleotide-binding universal stress UspA family protein